MRPVAISTWWRATAGVRWTRARPVSRRKTAKVKEVEPLSDFIGVLDTLRGAVEPFLRTLAKHAPHVEPLKELDDAILLFKADVDSFRRAITERQVAWREQRTTNGELKKAVGRLAPLADTSRGLVRQAAGIVARLAGEQPDPVPTKQEFLHRQYQNISIKNLSIDPNLVRCWSPGWRRHSIVKRVVQN